MNVCVAFGAQHADFGFVGGAATDGEGFGLAQADVAHGTPVQMSVSRHKVEPVEFVFEDLFALISPESPFKW